MTVPILTVPATAALPLVVTVPHAGRRLTPELVADLRVPTERLRALEDPWVDELVVDVPQLGGWLLTTPWARAVVDVNRAPDEFAAPAGERSFRATAKARVGLGVVPTVVGTEPLYRGALAPEQVATRLALAHTPYHVRLQALLEQVRARFGMALLLDCHSMPSTALTGAAASIDLALGDCHGRSAGADVAAAVHASIAEQGLRVERNRPYAGGYVSQHYGRPRDHVHVLQLELRRGLYMDEARYERGPGFLALKARLGAAFAAIAKSLELRPAPYLAAAGI